MVACVGAVVFVCVDAVVFVCASAVVLACVGVVACVEAAVVYELTACRGELTDDDREEPAFVGERSARVRFDADGGCAIGAGATIGVGTGAGATLGATRAGGAAGKVSRIRMGRSEALIRPRTTATIIAVPNPLI